MIMSLSERRRNRKKWIKRHKRLLMDLGVVQNNTIHNIREDEDISDKDGIFSNNNIVNKYTHFGHTIKTKTKNRHAAYRSHGGYGKSKVYSRHDQRQVDSMNEEYLNYYRGYK